MMKEVFMYKFLKVSIFLLFINNAIAASSGNIDVNKIRKAIVTINSRISVSAYKNTGNWSGTGFVVDKEKGYLVTNNHVVGRGAIGTYFVTFDSGQQAEAKVVYYDQYADLAILKIEPDSFPSDVEVIEFTNQKPKLGDDVFIIGNNEGIGFSFHSGHLSDLYEIQGEMPQGCYNISLNSAGGSSGSPILNLQGKAIGVLFGGGQTHAIALKAFYVQHILDELKKYKKVKNRKHIGIITGLYSLDKAVRHRNFPKKYMQEYINRWKNARNRVVVVRNILSGSKAGELVKPGDIILKVDGQEIGPDLTILDNAMNMAKIAVKLTIMRNGKIIEPDINIYDIEKNKIFEILNFAGGFFFEADDYVAYKAGIPMGKVSFANVTTGSSFSEIPESFMHDNKNLYRILLRSIDGNRINNLNDLKKTIKKVVNKKYINIEYQNFQPYYPIFDRYSGFISSQEYLMQDITFDSIDTKPRILRYDDLKYEWITEELR